MTKVPVKYVVRVREDEHDARTERVWEFLNAKKAQALANKAAKHGLSAVVLKVLDKSKWERV